MTTDITELAQREKFEAWAEERCALPWGYLKNRRTNTGYFSKHDYTSLWAAWKAAGAELVEALEKAQQHTKERDAENQDLMLTVGRLRVEREGLEVIRAAAEKLVRCKGRYHSEQNYRALAALFGVNTPDFPPLEHENVHYADAAEMEIAALRQRIAELESRTVTAPQNDYFASLVALARVSADKAMKKFPQPNYVLLKVAEEAGEVVQAGVHYAENRMEWKQVEGEIVQLLAMLIRLVTEGDQINGVTPPASCAAGIKVEAE